MPEERVKGEGRREHTGVGARTGLKTETPWYGCPEDRPCLLRDGRQWWSPQANDTVLCHSLGVLTVWRKKVFRIREHPKVGARREKLFGIREHPRVGARQFNVACETETVVEPAM